MTYSAFNFTGGASSPDQTIQPGLQQYLAQGQMGINPGQAQTAASSPISSAAQYNLAKALAGNQPQLPAQVDPAQAALTNGAIAQPNVNGQNMGGVGPTVNNAAAMQGYQGMTTQQPTMEQQLGNYLSGLFSGGNSGG